MVLKFNDMDGLPYRKSYPLDTWDYSNPGWYFVTICTKNRKPYFGNIRQGIMGLSSIGCIVWKIWKEILFNNILTDECIVMPNHLHGIVRIADTGNNKSDLKNVDTSNQGSSEDSGDVVGDKNIMKSEKHLGRIIQWFKGRCTYEIHRRDHWEFSWQSRYYDWVLRNRQELLQIRVYIRDNPIHWKEDDYYYTDAL